MFRHVEGRIKLVEASERQHDLVQTGRLPNRVLSKQNDNRKVSGVRPRVSVLGYEAVSVFSKRREPCYQLLLVSEM